MHRFHTQILYSAYLQIQYIKCALLADFTHCRTALILGDSEQTHADLHFHREGARVLLAVKTTYSTSSQAHENKDFTQIENIKCVHEGQMLLLRHHTE